MTDHHNKWKNQKFPKEHVGTKRELLPRNHRLCYQFQVYVWVRDERKAFGRHELLVSPVCGSGEVWVNIINTAEILQDQADADPLQVEELERLRALTINETVPQDGPTDGTPNKQNNNRLKLSGRILPEDV